MKYVIKNDYTLDQLAKPETYAGDEALARLCRHIIAPEIDLPTGAAKRAVLDGRYPELVKPVADEHYQAYLEALQKVETVKTALPEGFSLTLTDPMPAGWDVLLKPETFQQDLHNRLKRLGAYWDGQQVDNRRLWVLPIEKATSLPRLFKNHAKAMATEQEQVKARKEAERLRQEAEQKARDAAYAEQRQLREQAQKKRAQQQDRARSERVKVKAGKYQVGDLINGKAITGFGQSWIEKGDAPKEFFAVQLWEPCRCGNEPVYAPSGLEYMGSQMCEKCINKRFGTDIEFCYAYFS